MASVVWVLLPCAVVVTLLAANSSGQSNSCICYDLYKPVCGVDGKTYTNACFANCKTCVKCAGACPCSPCDCCGPNPPNVTACNVVNRNCSACTCATTTG